MIQIGIAIVVLLCVAAWKDWSLYDERNGLVIQIEQEFVRKRKRKRCITVFGEGEYCIGSGFGSAMKIHTERTLSLLITVSETGEIIFRVLKGIVYYRGEVVGENALPLHAGAGDILKTEDGTILYVERYRREKKGGGW